MGGTRLMQEMVDEFKRFLDRVSPDEFASDPDD